jgi:hypothetical protein
MTYYSKSPASTIIGAIGGASPKPGNGEGCIRKGIRCKILASALLFFNTDGQFRMIMEDKVAWCSDWLGQ